MKFEGYTPEIFIENFKKDSEVFGEEFTKYLYEEAFSTVCGKRILFNGIIEEIKNLSEDEVSAAEATNTEIDSTASTLNKALSPAGLAGATLIAKPGIIGKLWSFLKTVPSKVKTFFGNIGGTSFGSAMKNGFAWLKANPTLALKTTGGLAMLAILIRALKKKHELNKYENLRNIAMRREIMREDCYDTVLGDSEEKKAMRKIVEECQTNKALNELMFGEIKEKKSDKFNY